MAFCRHCGEALDSGQRFCPKCGTPVNQTVLSKETTQIDDSGGFGWGLLGFCIPIVGLVLYLVWKDDRPLTAEAAGAGALVGFLVGIVLALIF